MLLGRRAGESAQPGGRLVLERRRSRARIVGPGAGGATGEDQGEPDQDRAQEAATGPCPRLGRTRRAARSLRVGAHLAAVCNPAGRSMVHGALLPATASRQARQQQSGQAANGRPTGGDGEGAGRSSELKYNFGRQLKKNGVCRPRHALRAGSRSCCEGETSRARQRRRGHRGSGSLLSDRGTRPEPQRRFPGPSRRSHRSG